jgi:hypothetical protein
MIQVFYELTCVDFIVNSIVKLCLFRTHLKERFLADLRKAREHYKGEDLVKVCGNSFHEETNIS